MPQLRSGKVVTAGEKNKGIRCKRAARCSKGIPRPISDTAVYEGQVATTDETACWEETVRRGRGIGQQHFFSETTLQNKFSAGIERKDHSSEGPDLSGLWESSWSSGKKGKYSFMEIKLPIPSSEKEIESTERCGISCLPEPEMLQLRKGTCSTEMKSTDSIMTPKTEIPDLNLGTQESSSEPKPQEEVDTPEKLDGRSLTGSKPRGTQKKGQRCLSKKDRPSLLDPQLQSPRDGGRSALLEVYPQSPEPKRRAACLRMRDRNGPASQQLQGLSGQGQPTTRRKMPKHCIKEELQSSYPQTEADSLQESAEEKGKAVEQDCSTQAAKKLETSEKRSDDSKEPHYYKSTIATLGETPGKSFLCHPLTKKSDVQCEKREPTTDQFKNLKRFTVTTAEKVGNVSAERDAEHCRNTVNHCNGTLCATRKNPFVRLDTCSYISRLVKSSNSGTTSSYKFSEFFHVARHNRKDVFPDSTLGQSDMNLSNSKMQKETSPIKDGLSFNEEKNPNGEGCFSCCQSENSKCLWGKKWDSVRKPRKKKITKKSAAQNIFTDVANECTECDLKTEAAAGTSSSIAVLRLNHKEMTSCDHIPDLHIVKNTCEAEDISVWRKNSTNIPAFEDGFKKTPECSVIEEGELDSVAHRSGASGSLRVLAQVRDFSNCHKNKIEKKLNKVNKKLHQFSCQRTIAMTGKNVWRFKSCARTSEWVHKNHGSISEGRRLLRPFFKESSDESTIKTVGNIAVSGNVRCLDLQATEINEKSTFKIMGPNTECLTSLQMPGSSSMHNYETLRMSSANVESPVNMDGSAVAFNHDNVQEAKANLNFTTKQKDKNKGTLTKRKLSATVQNDTPAGNTDRINFSHKMTVVNQTFSDSKQVKILNTGNLPKFSIPLCRNKPESRRLESVRSCSPLELTNSSSVSGRQKTNEKTFLVNSKQQLLPVVSDATATASMQKADTITSKDFQHDGSENLSNDIFALPEHFPERELESSVLGFCATECVLKPHFADHSQNAVGHPVALEINDDSKPRETLSQHKSKIFPDIHEAYEEDVLVIDVIEDDPDLFGTNNEEELCPVKASYASICIKDEKQDLKPQDPLISENRASVEDNFRKITVQESGMSNDTEKSCHWMVKAENIKTHDFSRGSNPMGDIAEDFLEDGQLRGTDKLLKSFDMDKKFSFADGVPDVKQEKSEAEKSDCKHEDLTNHELLSGLPLTARKVDDLREATVMKLQRTDYRFSGNSPLLLLQDNKDFQPWKMAKREIACHSVQQILQMMELPRKYCRFYFMTLRGCGRAKCWFGHVPEQGDEKICMTILRTYISIKEPGLLKRAVQIFVEFYREGTPGVDFASQVLNDLLISLLKNSLLQEVFQILNVTMQINTLPAVDVLLKVFEHVASLNIRDAVPTLISTFYKFIDAGMFLESEHFDYILKFLHQLKVSREEINTVLNIKSRFQEKHLEKSWLFDFNLAMAEIQHCKEKSDWTKLGALFIHVKRGCEHFGDLQKLSLCTAEILCKDLETQRPGVPFCDFADAVIKKSHHNEADRIFIGRIGISVMYSYFKALQWIKGRKVLDKLHELQIDFTVLKGLSGTERLASRCQIVNKAAEIFLKTGSLDGAMRVLRESKWTTNTPMWPCDKTDILNRHNLLCTLVHRYLGKNLYRQAFEVLQNLPGFLNSSDAVGVSQYSCLFNKLIRACFESKNLGVPSSAVDFMLSKNIAIDFFLLRELITALGRNSLWSKARTYYKSALSLGCYPPLEGNLYRKTLMIPSYLSEVEMLLAIEILLVSNASGILSPMTTSQTLQIILKRSEDQTDQKNSDYAAAVERLILAAHLCDPKLFLKHMTMNVNMEEVYTLEFTSAVKWLQENMKWAGKVWLFQ